MRPGTTGRAWAYVGAGLGGAVSIAANVAHSYVPPAEAPADWVPESGAVAGAVFWPVAVIVAIEVLARVPWPEGRRWVALRFGGLLPVAVVAAVVSYRHLSGLLAFYGEDTLTTAIGPLAVDGLMVMATGALLATGSRARAEMPSVEAVARGISDTVADSSVAPIVPTSPDAAVRQVPDRDPPSFRTPQPTSDRSPRRTHQMPDIATAVARLADKHPDMSTAEMARRLKVSDRTVRRHLADLRSATAEVPVDPAAAMA